jgi:hypothetical protein
MNSFKKIALGLVAAMALGTVVATPASANTVSVAVTTKATDSDTGAAAAPLTVNVPFDNVISDTATTTSEVLTLTATVVAGTPVTFATSGNAKLLTAIGAGVTSASGVTTLTVTPASTTAVAYLYTTSTSASAVTVSVLGASTTLYVKGIAGPAFNVTLSVPATGNIGGSVVATATVTDIFGNPKAATPVFTAINATVPTVVSTFNAVQDALVTNKYTSVVTLPATGGSSAVGVSITAPTAVPTLATAVTSASAIVSTVDLAAALAAEKAAAALAAAKAASDALAAKAAADKAVVDAIAAEKAAAAKAVADAVALEKAAAAKALADAKSVSDAEIAKLKADNAAALAAMKKAFNALATQWNKKNPKAKVALIK